MTRTVIAFLLAIPGTLLAEHPFGGALPASMRATWVESPVAENKTPWDRVKNAAFEGSGGGECIYAGGQAAQDAHKGWWYSDGHRLILYSEAQAQGIAKFANTWTFLTGNFTKFPF